MKNKFNLLKTKFTKILQQTENNAKQKPFIALFITLGVLLTIIAISNYLKEPVLIEEPPEETQNVSIYSVGEAPRIQLSAEVTQSNVITIAAQTSGIVKKIYVDPGSKVYRGQQIITLSSDYYGNNASWLQKQLAQTQYDNIVDTYDIQKDIIGKQKDLAEKNRDNVEELRKITNDSINETKELLNLNELILAEVDLDIKVATTSSELSQLNSQKAQLLSGINQIKSGLRQAEYQGSEDTPPSKLAGLSKEMTLKQIEVQEKALEMSKTISELQLKLARVQSATMFPGTPVSGTIERVFVQKNQMVSPGTPLVTVNAMTGTTQLTARVSQNIAQKISMSEPTLVFVAGNLLEVYPDYVSSVPTEGSLYTITYTIPEEHSDKFVNTSFVEISVALGSSDTTTVIPYLPLEAVHQSELETTIFVLNEETVTSKIIELGEISGRFVLVKSGLTNGDQIILDREVIEGQKVTAK
jgi:multidrug efflux pump subunit AcrA (membrane-fusion protein)